MDKKTLRSEYLARRAGLEPMVRQLADQRICSALRGLECCRRAECLALYASDGEEPDLRALFGWKRTFLPRYAASIKSYELVEVLDFEKDLVVGRYGLLEPRAELPAAEERFVREKMVFLTPAVSCTRRGVRLGRGGGFYDRMLAGAGEEAIVGVIYSCQLAEELPAEPHDRKVGYVVTESGSWKCLI